MSETQNREPQTWALVVPRDLEAAPRAVKARLRFVRTSFIAATTGGAVVGGGLLALALNDARPLQNAPLALAAVMLTLGVFLAARAFEASTRTLFINAPTTRFVVQSVEKIASYTARPRWFGHFVVLKGVDQPGLDASIITTDLPEEFAASGKQVVGLGPERGEYVILGLTDDAVFFARPTAALPRNIARRSGSKGGTTG
jgi:hypothetical protein